MTDLLTNLTVAEREKLLKLSRSFDFKRNTAKAPPITRADRSKRIPLSFAQQRLWFLAQMEGTSRAYHTPLGLHLKGRLDRAALRQALDRILARHEALRTTFSLVDGEMAQTIAAIEESRFQLVEQDLRQPENGDEELDELIEREASAAFDLEAGPLIRGRLIRVSEDEHTLLITMHHIVSDGWSMEVLLNELSMLYGAFLRGETDPLPPLSLQYADYAVWQREWLQDEILERQVAYWRERLRGIPAALELPTDRPRPATFSHKGARHPLALSKELTASLKALSRREGVTLYMTLLAALQVVLSRWSGQDDIAVGSPIAGRTHRKTEGLIGFFLNTLVMRTDLSGDPTFVELLGRVRGVALGAYTHQDLPFEKLVAELQPERDLSRQALFQALFMLQNMPLSSLRLPGLTWKQAPLVPTTSMFDLDVELMEMDSGLEGSVDYATDLFDRETIERFAGNFKTLLEAVVVEADRPISELPLLGEAERRLLLEEWNETARDYPKEKLIHQLFEEQVKRTPDAVALVYEDEQLTYLELDRRTNRLAHYLQTLGVGPETRVGICMERSLEMIVGLLGILKAGGAYAPLDPAYPVERLRSMLDDSDAPVLIAQKRIADRLPEVTQRRVYLDSDWEAIEQYPDTAPPTATLSANLAHIIYTSGSTGRPKAVAAVHSAVVNRLEAEREISGVSGQEVCCQKTSIGFVDAVAETWGPLLSGRLLIVASENEARNPRELFSLISRERITRLVTVPSLAWSMVESEGVGEDLKSLRSWTLSGEALPGELLRRLRQSLPECRLINLYGSSEVAADATCYAEADGAERVTVPIGRPIANSQSYVLDRSLELVPLGVIGELYIGGEGLARGYLGEGGLTAERFVANPYGAEGSRLYRTGDLGRRLADGNLEFIGRADGQVKIRGVRIELGEIETALLERPEVHQAVVVAREEESGEKRLVAYCVGVEGRAPEAEDLRHHLLKRLPPSMAPAAFVFLTELPLNSNGKVDRQALPAPELGVQLERRYAAPRTPTEEVLAQIWAEVLGLERVGVEDNFFVLGGHSLLATQVIARVRESFGVEVPVRALFEASVTVRELGEEVERTRREQQGLQAPPLAPRPRQGPLPLSLAQERLWFLEQLAPLGNTYNEIMGLELDGALDQAALEGSFAELVRRHESLRTRIETTADGQGRQVIDPAGGFRMGVVDLTSWPEAGRRAEAVRLAQAEATRPFELSRELFRVWLIRLSAEEHILLVMLHHIISDVWSLAGILLRELSVLYTAYQEGRSSPLPELEAQYADYALWQREWLQGEILERQVAYWRERLRGMPAALELPTDRPRPATPSYKGARQRLALSKELTASLRALSRREDATLYMTLLAALQVLLSRWSGQEDIAVGSPIAGRTHRKMEGLIGFFVNTLVMRTDLSGDPTFVELLGRVRSVALGAYTHQDLPFEKLVAELQPERDLSRQALFQVMFTLQNMPMSSLRLPGLTWKPAPLVPTSSKFDLAVEFFERDSGLEGSVEYATDLFDRETIERFAGNFKTLLEAVVEEADRPISELPLLGEAERRLLLEEWNETARDYPKEKLIHQLFEEQVKRTPDAVALVYEDEQLTYLELDRRTNRLAHYLQTLGVGPETRVGICMERSLEMIVGLLGILKAGGAYAPLDPAYPVERLRSMLDDSDAPVLIAQKRIADRLPEVTQRRVYLDSDWEAIEQYPDTAPPTATLSANLAHIIYTSGSTGRPKAVAAVHSAVVNRLEAEREISGVSGQEVCCQKTSIGFVDAVAETWGPLLSGRLLIVASENEARNPRELFSLISRERITRLVTVPSLAWSMVESERVGEDLKSLRSWTLSGEALPGELLRRLRQSLPECRLINLYGSSEVAADATCYAEADGAERVTVPIGRPIANSQSYVLDRSLELVPLGVIGELYIGGEGLARGYLGEGGLTAERFVANPYGVEGSRLYRTGDLGRRLADGNLEFIGRADGQVKIRGVRIELGEIETALLERPEVHQAVVVAREEESGEKRLVAYCVGVEGRAPEAEDLRHHLLKRLPPSMAPAAFVFLTELPLNSNGKVDRQALPAPELGVQLERRYAAPRTPTEEVLAQIWAEVLGLERVGVEDNFFVLGGHSLLATQVIARVRESFGVEVPVRALFEASVTVRELGEEVERTRREQQGLQAPPLAPRPRQGPLPLSLAQERLWFLEQLAPLGNTYNGIMGLELDGALDQAALEGSFAELVRRHESLRTRIETTADGQGRQVIDPAGRIPDGSGGFNLMAGSRA